MNSIADRLTRAYCLFHWLHGREIPEHVKATLSYSALEQELSSLQVQPEDFSAVAAETADTFEESRLAFMVRYCGLTWSTCSVFCDAVENKDWLLNGTPFLVTFDVKNTGEEQGLKRMSLSDFMFLKPQKVWMSNGRVKSFVVRWNKHEARRIERFLKLTAARHGIEISVNNIAKSEQFIQSIKGMIGAA